MIRPFILTILILSRISIIVVAQQSKPIYNVFDFGAKGDGLTNDQIAIQKAINACEKTGGTVLLKKGKFLTGQLLLVSNMTLQIDTTAIILGIKSGKETDYPHQLIETKYPNRMLEDCQRRLIYGNHVTNVTIKGGGIINGQGDHEEWMNVKNLGTEKTGLRFLHLLDQKIFPSPISLYCTLPAGHRYT